MYGPAFEYFLEFGAHCFENYPLDVSINASTLVRTGVIGPLRDPRPTTLRSKLRRLGGVNWLAARMLLRRARQRTRIPHGAVSVLGVFPFNRRDYDDLILPLLHGVSAQGARSAVVIPEVFDRRWVHLVECAGTAVTTLESEATARAYRDCRRTLAALRPALRDVAARFGMSSSVQHDVFAYFARFALQKALASRFIELFSPRVVLGLHFVYARGWQAAIAEAKGLDRELTVVLVQHGAFELASGFHDFEGADLVLLWGERWKRELQRFASLPFRAVPAAVVTGNPKFDEPVNRVLLGAERSVSENRRYGRARVLYVSSHEGGKTLLPPLDMTVKASRREEGFEVIVKPHPAERDGTIGALVDSGELLAESILSPRHVIRECILDADVVVGPRSTALFEAARLGKPVVLISESPGTAFEGLATAVGVEGLHASVERLVRDADWRERVLAGQAATLQDAFGEMKGGVDAAVGQIGSLL